MKKTLFIHIPRTSGSSIIESFKNNKEFETIGHKKLTSELSNRYKNYFKFAIVRNPWSRFISSYHSMICKACLGIKVEGTRGSYNKELSTILITKNIIEYIEYCKKYIPLSITPQLWYLKDEYGKLNVDYIGRYENLKESLNIVSTNIERNIDIKKERVHYYGDYDYRDFYDYKTKEIIREIFQQDIKYFNYKFDDGVMYRRFK